MKIVYVTNEYPGLTKNFGGIAVVFENEVIALRNKGFNVEVILVTNNELNPKEIPSFVRLYKFPLKGRAKGLRGRYLLAKFININYSKEDIVVCADFAGLLPSRLKPTKIVQLHGSATLNAIKQNRTIDKLTFLLEYFTLRTAKRIRGVSKSVYTESLKHFSFIRNIESVVIHNGIESNQEMNETNDYNGFETKNVIFIGKLSQLKGVHFLGEIINGIHKTMPGVEFTIIGHDEVKDGISQKENLVNSLHSKDQVIFIDRVSNKEIPQYLSRSSLLILPSMTEALPMVVIEAFAAGRPVVAFNVGGLSEMIENKKNGYLVETFDIISFIEKSISILKDNQLFDAMSNKAAEKFNSSFKLETTINKLLQFYNCEITKKA